MSFAQITCCLQFVAVFLYLFCPNSLLKGAPQPKIAKRTLKRFISRLVVKRAAFATTFLDCAFAAKPNLTARSAGNPTRPHCGLLAAVADVGNFVHYINHAFPILSIHAACYRAWVVIIWCGGNAAEITHVLASVQQCSKLASSNACLFVYYACQRYTGQSAVSHTSCKPSYHTAMPFIQLTYFYVYAYAGYHICMSYRLPIIVLCIDLSQFALRVPAVHFRLHLFNVFSFALFFKISRRNRFLHFQK